MSLSTKARIKQIKNTNFTAPLGTDGQLVDMKSGLDLQQQIRLGGGGIVTIQEGQIDQQHIKYTTIIEQRNNYKIITTITEEYDETNTQVLNTTINQQLQDGDIYKNKQIIFTQSDTGITINETPDWEEGGE